MAHSQEMHNAELTGEVRRIDVGDGIYVHVPGPAHAPLGDASPARAGTAVTWAVPLAAFPLAAAAAAAGLARHGATEAGWLAAGLLAVLAVLAAIDLRWRVLPNRIVVPATAAVLVWQLVFATARVPEGLAAGLGAAIFLALPSLFRRGAVGMGDVKLGALLGLALGAEVVTALLIGFLATAPVTLALLARGRDHARDATLPLGPFLGLGAAVVLLG